MGLYEECLLRVQLRSDQCPTNITTVKSSYQYPLPRVINTVPCCGKSTNHRFDATSSPPAVPDAADKKPGIGGLS